MCIKKESPAIFAGLRIFKSYKMLTNYASLTFTAFKPFLPS